MRGLCRVCAVANTLKRESVSPRLRVDDLRLGCIVTCKVDGVAVELTAPKLPLETTTGRKGEFVEHPHPIGRQR
jgi:hypothetical protein